MAPPGPGGGAGEAAGVAPDGAGAAGAVGLGPPEAAAVRISFLLMRPPAPLPSIDARSTLCSLASFRTSGELRIFWPFSRTAGGGGAVAGALAAAAAGAGTGAGAAGAAGAAAALGAAALSGVAGGAGVAAGTDVDAASAAPAASITATTVWMGTVCPSVTLIS